VVEEAAAAAAAAAASAVVDVDVVGLRRLTRGNTTRGFLRVGDEEAEEEEEEEEADVGVLMGD